MVCIHVFNSPYLASKINKPFRLPVTVRVWRPTHTRRTLSLSHAVLFFAKLPEFVIPNNPTCIMKTYFISIFLLFRSALLVCSFFSLLCFWSQHLRLRFLVQNGLIVSERIHFPEKSLSYTFCLCGFFSVVVTQRISFPSLREVFTFEGNSSKAPGLKMSIFSADKNSAPNGIEFSGTGLLRFACIFAGHPTAVYAVEITQCPN